MAAPLRHPARAAVRSQSSPQLGPDQVVVGDIDGQTDWSRALAGIDCVVHLAAHVHVMNPTPKDRIEFERTNVLGSERLARSAAESGVKRFVYLSSIKVNGEHTAARAFRADDVPHPQDDYARSKLEAERRLADIGASSDMAVAVVRPPLVYGAGVRANFLRLLSLAHSGLPLPLASIANVRSMVSVWNLCDLIRALLQHGQPMTGVFLAGDGEDVSTAELVRRLARDAGIQAWDQLSPHCLRHSAITFALDAGAALRDVQDYAGHKDPHTTRRYDHARDSLDRNAAYIVAAYLASAAR